MIRIQVKTTALTQALDRILGGLHDTAPLMQEISIIMLGAVDENFEQGGRPGRWAPLADGKPSRLQRTGRLRGSMVRDFDRLRSIVGTNLVYAPPHVFGAQTAPHVIRPRNKKALKFNGKIRRSVNHPGSKIPVRNPLMLPDEDMDEIEQTAQGYLQRLIDG
jgi:phage gpG-like protein